MLDLWCDAQPAEEQASWWNTWAQNSLALVLHNSGGIKHRLEDLVTNYPLKGWKVVAAEYVHGKDAMAQASHELMSDPPCCKDGPFGLKLCNLAGVSRNLREGPVYQGMQAAAPHAAMMNTRLERHMAQVRGTASIQYNTSISNHEILKRSEE